MELNKGGHDWVTEHAGTVTSKNTDMERNTITSSWKNAMHRIVYATFHVEKKNKAGGEENQSIFFALSPESTLVIYLQIRNNKYSCFQDDAILQ